MFEYGACDTSAMIPQPDIIELARLVQNTTRWTLDDDLREVVCGGRQEVVQE